MAKAKQERTPEQIQAAKDRMAKVRAARQDKNPETKTEAQTLGAEEILSINQETPIEEMPTLPVDKQPDKMDEPDVGDLVRQVQELKAMMFDQVMQNRPVASPTPEGVSVQNGKMTGTIDRYSMDLTRYPDPRDRLAQEPKLARFAFSMNYELEWEVGETAYENIERVRMREPKFTLTLIKIMIDEETGEPSNGRYDICRLIMHEDPVAALTIAREEGLNVDEMDEVFFLNEMRYLRMRDWLLEAFYPSKVTTSKNKRDMVINGKLVAYWEKTTEADGGDGGIKKLDWDNLPKVKF